MRAVILSISLLLSCVVCVPGQTSVITYQGRLTDGSLPANGVYQMTFSLFDAPAGGAQDGSMIELTSVQVVNGVFSVKLDFGTDPFPFGANRYLQIEIRRNSGEAYTPLTPRQQITTSPYAIRTLIANAAENSFRLGGINANQYVQTTDSRLSDARTPIAGSANYVQNRTTTQTGTNFDIDGTGEAGIFNARTQFNFNGSRILSAPGTNNTFVGVGTGTDLTSGFGNSFVGRDSGGNTTTGNRNTFSGSGSGFENISGSDNSFFGFNSGLRITSGIQNSFFGVSAGSANLIGQNNAFFGYESGLLATNSANTFIGAFAGRQNTSAAGNTFIGNNSGRNNQTGASNTFLGNTSGNQNSTGGENTFIGYLAGSTSDIPGTGNTTGSNNTTLGAKARTIFDDMTYATAIGSGAIVTENNRIQIGRDGLDTIRIGTLAPATTSTQVCLSTFRVLSSCLPGTGSIEALVVENGLLRTKVELLESKLYDQQRQLEVLRLLVCSDRPDAKLCVTEKEDK